MNISMNSISSRAFSLLICGWLCVKMAQSVQQNLWLDCSCMHATERNGSSWGAIALNSSLKRSAKNDCYMIFIMGTSDEIVAFRFREILLRAEERKRNFPKGDFDIETKQIGSYMNRAYTP